MTLLLPSGRCMKFQRMCHHFKRGSTLFAVLGFLLLAFRSGAQTLEETQQKFLGGSYDDVIEITTKKLQQGQYLDGWRVLQVKSLLTVGHYAEANTAASSGLDDFPGSIQ